MVANSHINFIPDNISELYDIVKHVYVECHATIITSIKHENQTGNNLL